MTRKPIHVLLGSLAAAAALAIGSTAFARTIPASSGTSASGAARANFNITTQGVTPAIASPGSWLIPVPLDTPGMKSINVLGKVNAGNAAGCIAFSLSPAGVLLGSTPLTQWTADGAFHNITLNLSAANVPSGAQLSLVCTFSGTSGIISGLNYTP